MASLSCCPTSRRSATPEAGGWNLVFNGARFSTLLALVFCWRRRHKPALFGHSHYQNLVRLVALVQMGIAWANYLLALMKGFRDAAGNAFR